MFKVAEDIRNEFCIQIKGLVRARPEGTTNDKLKSGQIEVLCHELTVLNASVTPRSSWTMTTCRKTCA